MAANAVSKQEWRAFFIHLSLYIVVNLALVAINLASQPQKVWFIWPLIGWGIGLAAHALTLYLHAKASSDSLLARPEARGFISHLFVYVAVNLLLVFINLRTTPNDLWFQWPLLGWGLALFVHGLLLRSDVAAPANAAKPARARAPRRTKSKAGAAPRRRAAKKS